MTSKKIVRVEEVARMYNFWKGSKPRQFSWLTYNFYVIYVFSIIFVVFYQAIKNFNLVNDIFLKKIYMAIGVTITSIALVALIGGIIGIWIAYSLSKVKGNLAVLSEVLFTLPASVPPIVLGVGILLFLGKNIAFSFTGIVIAQITISLPFIIKGALIAFRNIDPDIVDAAYVDGATEKQALLKVIIPIQWKNLVSSILIGVARALGDVGATALIGGLIEGKTLTLSCAVFSYYQTGDFELMCITGAIAALFALVIMYVALRLNES